MAQKMLDLFGDQVQPVLSVAPVVRRVAPVASVPLTPVPVPSAPPKVVKPVKPVRTQRAQVVTKEAEVKETFDECVQSLRSLVFEEMGHSKNLKTKDKARLGNFREQKLIALGGKSDRLQKHGSRHLKEMRQAKTRKLLAQEQTVKHLQLVSETTVKFRAGEAERRKKTKLKERGQRKQAAKFLGSSP